MISCISCISAYNIGTCTKRREIQAAWKDSANRGSEHRFFMIFAQILTVQQTWLCKDMLLGCVESGFGFSNSVHLLLELILSIYQWHFCIFSQAIPLWVKFFSKHFRFMTQKSGCKNCDLKIICQSLLVILLCFVWNQGFFVWSLKQIEPYWTHTHMEVS